MAMISWRTTILAIRLSIWPQKNDTLAPTSRRNASSTPYLLNNLAGNLDNKGTLDVKIPGCHLLAAPFILFRLKREGFSDCQAIHENGGLTIRARR